jgi:hypothetical protein
MYPDNSWYSHRNILAKYCGVRLNIPIFGSLLHGHIAISEHKSSQIGHLGKRKFTIAPAFLWNKKQLEYSKREGNKNIYAIGAPFLYLHKLKKNLYKKNKPQGTIVFPIKSDFSNIQDNTLINLLRIVEKRFPKPYTLCLSHQDYKYKKRPIKNWKIITCGSRNDTRFLYKLYKFLNKNKNIISTYSGSVVLYSLYLKKKTFILDKYIDIKKKKKILFNKENHNFHLNVLKDFKKYEIDNNNLNLKKNYKGVLKILGYDCLKDREELKELLGWNSTIKTFCAKLFILFYDFIKGKNLRKLGKYDL